jgi:hypothetical protein
MTGYVEWVERVLAAAIAAKQVSRGPVFATMVARELGFPNITMDDFNPRQGAPEAVMQGLGDLADLTVLEFNNLTSIVVGQLAEDVALTGLRREAWPVAFEPPLNEPTVAFLRDLVALSEQREERFAWLTWHEAKEVFERLNMPTADFDASNANHSLIGNLKSKRFIETSGPIGHGNAKLRPTYIGVVRATQHDQWEWLDRLEGLVEEWETTTTEFKREIDLSTDAGKEKLVRSILSLATTKTNRPRYLILGFGPDTHKFAKSLDTVGFTSDRIEDLLNFYADHIPPFQLHQVRWEGGVVGIVEVARDPVRIPYRVANPLGRLVVGQILVRHGSHIDAPTNIEREELKIEGRRARGEL